MDDATAQADARAMMEHAADIVAAYVSNNSVPMAELGSLLASTHAVLMKLKAGTATATETQQDLVPAVPVKRSVSRDFIVCLENGKKFKSLRRHLSTLGMTPDEYRAKWGLPKDYPMVAPAYSEQRSALAKESGLGAKGGSQRVRGRKAAA